jgi:quinol monooxygenase YgiN
MRKFVFVLSTLALLSSALLAADEKPAPSLQDRLKAVALDKKVFTLVVEISIKPESIAKVEKIMLEAVKQTNKEPGCQLYDVHRNPEQPGKYVFLERFNGVAGLDAHLAAQYTKDLLAAFGSESSEPPKIMLLDQFSPVNTLSKPLSR